MINIKRIFLIFFVLILSFLSCGKRIKSIVYYDQNREIIRSYLFINDSVFIVSAIMYRDTLCNFSKGERKIKCRYEELGHIYGPFQVKKNSDGFHYLYVLPDSGVLKSKLEYSLSRDFYYVDDIESRYRNRAEMKRCLIDTSLALEPDILVYKNVSAGYGDDSYVPKNFYWIDYVSNEYGVLIKREFYKEDEVFPYRVVRSKFSYRYRIFND